MPQAEGRPRPDRCPLCSFPSADVASPEAALAAAIEAEYPNWRRDDGLCGRCADRFRFAVALGGRA